jgi:outer membrane usher protein
VNRPSRSARLGLVLLAALGGPSMSTIALRAEEAAQRAILEVTVNQVPKGETIVVIEVPDRLWMTTEFLTEAGLEGFGGERRVMGGMEFVSVASLAPDVQVSFSERTLLVRLRVAPHLLRTTRLRQDTKPPDLEFRRNTSAFVNYSVSAQSSGRAAGVWETGFSTPVGFLTSGWSVGSGQPFVRGVSSWTIDDRRRLRRWVIGDTFASSGLLGGSVLLGGVTLSREYAIDPYFVQYPTLTYSGETTTPSTLEVYVNGRLVQREQLPPGPFELEDLPLPAGRGEAEFIVRDAFGREQQVSSPFYLSTATLNRGLHDYQYGFGYPRRHAGTSSWDYGKWAFVGKHRVGLTDWLTVGGRVDGTPNLVSTGPFMAARFPFGEVQAAGSVSRTLSTTDFAGALSYRLLTRTVSFGASAVMIGPRYATVSLGATQDRPRLQVNGLFSLPVGRRASLSLQHSYDDRRDGDARSRTAATGYFPLTRQSYLQATLARAQHPDGPGFEGFVGVGVFLGNQLAASLSYEQDVAGGRTLADVQRSMPYGVGYGYRVRYEEGADRAGGAQIQYQGRFARADVQADVLNGTASTMATASGALVFMGGGVHPTRPVSGSYALLRVPGVAGVRAYVSNQEIGRTNGRGDVLVPNLLAYYGNRVSIEDQDVPFQFGLSRTSATMALPYRGGALLTFPVQRGQRTTGVVLLRKGPVSAIPAYGELRLEHDGQAVTSPIGSRGEFYLDTLPPGTYEATLRYRGSDCTLGVTVPDAQAPVADLGTLVCRVTEADEP